jgi:hypothetical protein
MIERHITNDVRRCPARRFRARPRRRGIALLLVLAAVALATVVGLAMLSSSALQAQVRSNAQQHASAEYLAESGVQAALYYLQYPHLRPPSWSTTPGYYVKATNVSMPDADGRFDVEVTETGTRDVYVLRAVGRPVTGGGSPSVITARAKVTRATINGAGLFGGNMNLPLGVTVDGPVQVNGTLGNLTGLLVSLLYPAALPQSAYRVPTLATINYYGADQVDRKYTMPDGTVGYAQQLLAAPVAPPVAAANNPGRVFFYSNTITPDLLLSTAGLNFNGTLVVKGGSLSVRAGGLQINPVAGMPGLIVEKDVNMYRTNNTLDVNGVAWVGRNITWTPLLGTSTGTTFRVTGALLMPSGSLINAPALLGGAALKYDSAKVSVPDLNTAVQPGKSVTVLAWNE